MRRAIMLFGAAALAILVLWLLHPAFTPPIFGPRSVASLEAVDLGGVRQWVLIRGQDRTKPILLFLHGGPGMPSMYLAHAFQRPLEKDFLVVQWDRRGAGKSYSPDIDPRTLRTSQELADAQQLIALLQSRYGRRPIIVVGHSYGSYLGVALVRARPDLVRAYVGVGQVACTQTQERAIQDRWLRDQAMAVGDRTTAAAAARGGEWDRETALFQYGGEVVRMKSFLPLVLLGLRATEYTTADSLKVKPGVNFTHAHFVLDGPPLPLSTSAHELPVPTWLFVGRRDYTTPWQCQQAYFASLSTPQKHWVWFNNSAHFPFLEQPEAFHQRMLEVAKASEATSP
jgi:pimeloyl-ACP methyl ester carboxylesterase